MACRLSFAITALTVITALVAVSVAIGAITYQRLGSRAASDQNNHNQLQVLREFHLMAQQGIITAEDLAQAKHRLLQGLLSAPGADVGAYHIQRDLAPQPCAQQAATRIPSEGDNANDWQQHMELTKDPLWRYREWRSNRPTRHPQCTVKRLVFIHVPKCGGRALLDHLTALLQRQLNVSNSADARGAATYPQLKDPLLSRDGRRPYIIEVHTQQENAQGLQKLLRNKVDEDGCPIVVATLLREPLHRAASMINYDLQTGCLPAEAQAHRQELYAETDNTMSRFLVGTKYCPKCGRFWLHKSSCQSLQIEEHRGNLALLRDWVDVVGVTEKMDEFVARVVYQMGLNNEAGSVSRGGSATQTDTAAYVQSIGQSERDIFKRHNEYDYELYNLAVEQSQAQIF